MESARVQGLMNGMRRRSSRVGTAVCAAVLLSLATASSASALTTIGQLAPGQPGAGGCAGAPGGDWVQPTVNSGTPYVVPPGGEKITSWSVTAGTNATQIRTLKIFRPISGTTYQVVGLSGPRTLTPATINTFPADIPVQPGDVLGFTRAGEGQPCVFSAPGDQALWSPFADSPVGGTTTFGSTVPDNRLNISATVGSTPSNDFSFGKVKKNKDKGIAILTVDVPNPGTLKLTGTGVKPQRSLGGAVASKEVTKAGSVNLKIKAKGSKKAKLFDRGKVKVKVKVTYTPTGDLPGTPATEPKRVKLVLD